MAFSFDLNSLVKNLGNNAQTNKLNNVSNELQSAPSQTDIQKYIQKIAPNPATKTTAYNATAPMQAFNGVNQGANGYLGMLKSLVTNRPNLKPITAKNVLGNDWYNQVISNINAKNQMKYNMALSNVLGNLLRTQMQTNADKQIANAKSQTEQQMSNNLLKVKEQYNDIMNKYFQGLLKRKDAELELKKLGIQNPQEKIAQVEYQARLKKYPDPATWWKSVQETYNDLGYGDIDIKNPDEINKAYQYYLQTGKLPQPKVDNGIFSDTMTGFNIGEQQYETQPQQSNQPQNSQEKQTATIPEDILKVKQNFEKNGINIVDIRKDKQGNIYFIANDGSVFQM